MQGTKWRLQVGGAVLAALILPMTATAQTQVDTELALLVDVSGSVSGSEFNLQRQGYVDAFNDASVVAAIQGGNLGTIAVSLIYWSSAGAQQQSIGWTQVSDAASASALATAIGNAGRPFFGATAPGSAIAYADPRFDNNGFDGARNVIDVSGDGAQNSGANTAGARDAFLAGGGDAINGIVIGGNAGVLNFYQTQVQGGANSFTLQVNTFAQFGDAIKDKLIREISVPPTSVPEPATISMLGLGLLGVFGAVRRRRRAC